MKTINTTLPFKLTAYIPVVRFAQLKRYGNLDWPLGYTLVEGVGYWKGEAETVEIMTCYFEDYESASAFEDDLTDALLVLGEEAVLTDLEARFGAMLAVRA